METIVQFLILAFFIYILLGVVIAITAQRSGLKKIDPSVEGAGLGFRMLTFPGIVGFWPIILIKWIKSNREK
ncbi:MAG: hypothetical protein P1U56_21750 [Saprospiraceae bacterium]|nr:hypothetical protein [Saprospiraceae bacterium]